MAKYASTYLPAAAQTKISQDHQVLRKQLKLSQQEFAKRAGISFASLKRFEQTGKISFESFLKLLHFHNRINNFVKIFENNSEIENLDSLFSDKTRKK